MFIAFYIYILFFVQHCYLGGESQRMSRHAKAEGMKAMVTQKAQAAKAVDLKELSTCFLGLCHRK